MFRLTLLFGILFMVGFVFAQDLVEEPSAGDLFAVTVREKEQLLEKTENTLKWFRSLGNSEKQRLSVKDFRVKILPLELMQAAAILKQKGQPETSRQVREILPFLEPTPSECFEIQERLGTETLESFQQERELLAGDTLDSATRIKEGATRFLKEFLNPAEKLALFREPQTPAEIMKAVDVLAVAGRPVVIRYYLQKFLEQNIEPAEYAKIAESIGSRKLLQIAGNKNFQPQGQQAAAKIYAEAKKFWQDEKTVAESLEHWQNPDSVSEKNRNVKNFEHLHGLWKGNNVSLPQLIEKLGETNSERELLELLAVLGTFSVNGRECLAAALNSGNPTLVFNAALSLAALIHADETFLLYPALFAESPLSEEQRQQIAETLEKRGFKLPNNENAAAELLKRANDYFEKKRSLKPAFDGNVRFWNWDEKEKKVKYIRMALPAAYRFFAYRYAEQAYRIKPEIQEIQRWYLTTLFERTAHLNGLDTPLDWKTSGLTEKLRLAASQPSQQRPLLEEVLQAAIRKEHYAAAQVAAQMLGMLNDKEPLRPTPNGQPNPLIQAVVAKDRRVRFAALESIMTIQPEVPYFGSSFVAETLVWFSRADGRRILVAAHPKQTDAAKTAGFFIGCGYQGELAQTCRNAMQLAAETPDTELVTVDLLTSEPPVSEFAQEMRNDPRTADIPIAILADNQTILESAPNFQIRPEMQKIDQLQPKAPFSVALSQTYPRIVSEDGAKWVNGDLFEKTGIQPVPPAIRIQQAQKSLQWIKIIVENAQKGRKIYHFEGLERAATNALRSDVRAEEGLELAAAIKSNAMQAEICETAANSLLPLELRQKAANAFKKSVQTFGVLLRGQQVQRLYDRYNAGEFEPKETQEILGNLIDLVEQKTDNKGKKP
jgi:hypothetical protein